MKSIPKRLRYHSYGEPDNDNRRDNDDNEHPTLEEVLVGLTLLNGDD